MYTHTTATQPLQGSMASTEIFSDANQRQALLDFALNNVREAAFLIDSQARFHYINAQACRALGYEPEELLSMHVNDVDPDYSMEHWPEHWAHLREAGSITFETRHRKKSGEIFPVEVTANYFEYNNQSFNLALVRNISERKQNEALLQLRAKEFRSLAENSPDSIARYDTDFRRVYVNPKMLAVFNCEASDLLGKTPMEFPGAEYSEEFQRQLQTTFQTGEQVDFEFRVLENTRCIHIRMTPEHDIHGKVTHVLAIGRDITEIDLYRKKIHHQAFFDTLTDLPNRSMLADRVRQTIAQAADNSQQFGLMFLDLDHFKEINDTLGHDIGDQLLQKTAIRLQHCIRSYDTLARLGGDEFAILLPEVREEKDLATIANKMILALSEPFSIEGKELYISVSIGIAIYPQDSHEIEALFKYADTAMYHAKRRGRNTFQFYEAELTLRSSERMAMESSLRKARKNNELQLYFQPQIELDSGRLTGAEALLRWNCEHKKLVLPNKFIPIAEESGLIIDIGEWVIIEACKTIARWNKNRATPLKMAINLSTRQFLRDNLVDNICRIIEETGCKPNWLELEITESLLLDDSHAITSMLKELNDYGISIAIDDFGTGYSALSYLSRFPVRQLKIDRSFILGIPDNPNKCELVKAMLSIGNALNLEVLAEGVETTEQEQFLKQLGCKLGQGYLFGKAMPATEFEKLLHR